MQYFEVLPYELPPIEGMSQRDMRREIVDSVDFVLGSSKIGPLVDGSADDGFKRREQGLPSLHCSYLRYVKIYNQETESVCGIQIELFSVWESEMLRDQKQNLHNKYIKSSEMTEAARKELQDSIVRIDEAIEKDGIAPDEHRYYYVPYDPKQQITVSTESFISRAHRANPQAVRSFFLEDAVEISLKVQAQEIDEFTGLPKRKAASLQDVRDLTNIVRGSKYLVRSAMKSNPQSGQVGLTE